MNRELADQFFFLYFAFNFSQFDLTFTRFRQQISIFNSLISSSFLWKFEIFSV